jgi:hypothetical protein
LGEIGVQYLNGVTLKDILGIDGVKDSRKRRFYSGLVRETSADLEFSVKKSRQDHLQASIPDMPKWAHLAVVFRPKEEELGVELHFENAKDDNNREALLFVQRNIESDVLPSGEKIHFLERSRPTQGWALAYIRKPYDEPTIDLRKWATQALAELFKLVLPAIQKAQNESII